MKLIDSTVKQEISVKVSKNEFNPYRYLIIFDTEDKKTQKLLKKHFSSLIDYCDVNSATPKLCPLGFQCEDPATKTSCTLGNYCPEGTAQEKRCRTGFFCANPEIETECTTPGSYCPEGSTSEEPCAAAEYCPTARYVLSK